MEIHGKSWEIMMGLDTHGYSWEIMMGMDGALGEYGQVGGANCSPEITFKTWLKLSSDGVRC